MTDAETETSESPAEATELVFLDVKKLRFFKRGATLRLTVEEDRSHLKVSVLRAFPLSKPDRFFSVQDGANKEVGMIVDPKELSNENRKLVHEDLERRYLLPPVKRILTAKERFGTVSWELVTDGGVRRLTKRHLCGNVQ